MNKNFNYQIRGLYSQDRPVDPMLWEKWFAPYKKNLAERGRELSGKEIQTMRHLFENMTRVYESAMDMGTTTVQARELSTELYTQMIGIFGMVFPNLIFPDLVELIAMPMRESLVPYRIAEYTDDKSDVVKGEKVLDLNTYHGYDTIGYSGGDIENEVIFAPVEEPDKFVAQGALSYKPIISGSVIISDGNLTFKDINSDGKLYNVEDNTEVGAVDYNSGECFASLPEGYVSKKAFKAEYKQDLLNSAANYAGLKTRWASKKLVAEPHILRTATSIFAEYDVNVYYNQDLEADTRQIAVQELFQELDGKVCNDLIKKAKNTICWDSYYNKLDPHITQSEHLESFINTISEASTMIYTETKVMHGNYVICGENAINALRNVGSPRVKLNATTNNTSGAFLAGTIDGGMNVYFNPFLEANQFLVGAKPSMNAGYIVGMYMPIYRTDPIVNAHFEREVSYATQYSTSMIDPKLYVSGKIVTKGAKDRHLIQKTSTPLK